MFLDIVFLLLVCLFFLFQDIFGFCFFFCLLSCFVLNHNLRFVFVLHFVLLLLFFLYFLFLATYEKHL